jgi:hypothetical protein
MMESSTCDYGKINVWELYIGVDGKRNKVSPSDADCFLHLFFSHSSDRVNIVETNSVDNWVELFLVGPPTSGGRLHVHFTLSRNALFDCLPEEKDRDAFADRLCELNYSGANSDKAFEALSLRASNRS